MCFAQNSWIFYRPLSAAQACRREADTLLAKTRKKNDLNEETGTWDAENMDRHVDVSNQHWQFQIETYFPKQTWFVLPFNVDSISKLDVIV